MNGDLHVAFCSDITYRLPTAVAISSLLRWNPHATVYLVTDDPTPPVPDSVHVLRPQPLQVPLGTGNHPNLPHLTAMTWQRLFLPERVGCKRLLYLDSDTLTMGSLEPLVDLIMYGNPIGAVIEPFMSTVGLAHDKLSPGTDYGTGIPGATTPIPPSRPYFNAGALLIDTGRWKNLHISERALDSALSAGPDMRFLDQDALNVAVDGKFTPLASCYNSIIDFDTYRIPMGTRIAHYAGPVKPWHQEYPDSHALRAWNYFAGSVADV